ncbi:MAG: hypothetical protein KAI43_00295 [Candidatus Aureabacteria bacterium]|nr:hypothetical protein [Candidatus Auribacterota bacterium]
MFDNLLDFWKGKDFLSEVLKEFESMLDTAHMIYDTAVNSLLDFKKDDSSKQMIYSNDRKVNEAEKDIRRRVIEHLAINPSVDVPTCLVLMSVVKDVERIGDYGKNLYEAAELLQNPLTDDLKKKYLSDLVQKLNEQFNFAKQAFLNSDKSKAKEVMSLEGYIIPNADKFIKELSNSDFDTNTSVCLVLSVRYLKRIAAHLANTASSVIMPVSDIDFYYKNKDKKDQN